MPRPPRQDDNQAELERLEAEMIGEVSGAIGGIDATGAGEARDERKTERSERA